jgi:hypothetical protein
MAIIFLPVLAAALSSLSSTGLRSLPRFAGRYAPRGAIRTPAQLRMAAEEGSGGGGGGDAFDGVQRLESAKAAVVGAVSGGLASVPVTLFVDGFNVAQWEFDVDTLSLACALFAVTYRYTVRDDANPMLRQGAIGAFALGRATAAVRVSDTCVPVPLRCEPYGFYVDAAMLGQGLGAVAVGVVAFGAAGAAMDWALEKGWISTFRSSSSS